MSRTCTFLLAVPILGASLFGCASSTESLDDTVVNEENMILTETQTMEGSAAAEEEATADYSGMFSEVANTAMYDMFTLAKMNPNLSTFVTLVEAAEFQHELTAAEGYTLFAPTNAAFAALPPERLDMLMQEENKAELIRLLQAHMLPTQVSSAEFSSGQRIETGGGDFVEVDTTADGASITVGGATIVKPDVTAANGILHVINQVMLPSEDVDH